MRVEKAIVIDELWISEILAGRKIWGGRKRPWRYRGPVGLIRKGSGLVVGVATMTDCHPPLVTAAAYAAAEEKQRIPPRGRTAAMAAQWIVPWELRDAWACLQRHPDDLARLDPLIADRHASLQLIDAAAQDELDLLGHDALLAVLTTTST